MDYKPKGMQAVVPYIVTDDVDGLIAFLLDTFEAVPTERLVREDGTVWHAEVRIGDSTIMFGGATEEYPPAPTCLYVYVPDTDAAYQAALDAGATSVLEPADQFYGDRNAGVLDAWGNTWWIGTHIEEVSGEEMARRAEAANSQKA